MASPKKKGAPEPYRAPGAHGVSLAAGWFAACKPRERPPLSKFMVEHARSDDGARIRPFPFQADIADAFTDPETSQLSVRKSSRIGYSTILQCFVAWRIKFDPARTLIYQPTIDDAEKFSRDDLDPVLQWPIVRSVATFKPRHADMAFANAEDATIAALANQPPGSVFRARTAFVRLSDSVAGPWSNYWIDNLAAAQITPTTFDPDLATGTGLYPAARLSEDKLTAYVGYGGGGNQKAWAIYARGIGAKIAYRPNAANGGILLASSTGASPALELALFADGYTALNGQQIGDFGFAVNDILAIELVANLTTAANIDAMISKNGGTARRFVLNWPTALFSGVFLGQDEGPNFTITDNTHWGTA